jgi:ADP-ribose pyrophosphatase
MNSKNSNASLVYRCKVFDVYEEDVRLPDGRIVRQTRIDHKPTVSVVPVDREGNLVLIRQYRSAVKKHLLETPAGNMDPGESVEETVQRELAEETGYQAGRLIKLFEGYLVPGYCNEFMYFYLAVDLFEKRLPQDEDEIIEIVKIPLEEALGMLKNGGIFDAKSAVGILMTSDYLKEHKN